MQNITIRRFPDTDFYALILEPVDHSWLVKIRQDGQPQLFLAEKYAYPVSEWVGCEGIARTDAFYAYREVAELGWLRQLAWRLGKPPKANEPAVLLEELTNAVQAEMRAHYEDLSASSGAVCALVAVLKARGLSTEGKINELAARVITLLPPL